MQNRRPEKGGFSAKGNTGNAEEEREGEKEELFSQLAASLLSQNPHGFSHIPRTSLGMDETLYFDCCILGRT